MNKRFFYAGVEVSEISEVDAEEITLKSDESMVALIKASTYPITTENKEHFLHYLGEMEASRILFVKGINSLVKKKIAQKVATQIGGDVVKVIKKRNFPKQNSADCIVLLNWN